MPSPAQYLPNLILEKIVDYLNGNHSWCLSCGSYQEDEVYRFITPLLEACSAWRDATLDRIYHNVWWCNVDNNGAHCQDWDKHFNAPRSLSRALDTGNTVRVKRVVLHFKGSMVLDGSLIELFDATHFSDLVLSGVSAIEFDFEDAEGALCDIDLFNNPDIAQLFCDKINRMFPNARKRNIQRAYAFTDYESSQFVRTLYTGLLANSDTISMSNSELYALSNPSATLLNLRSLSVWDVTIESPVIELIRRNAETLADLYVTSKQPAVFSRIVIDDDSTPIVYPRMKSLDLSYYDESDYSISVHLDSPAGTPFPSLRKLNWGFQYPFGNDILFRGNAHTLKYLDINVGPSTVETLKSHGIFKSDRLPSLRYAAGQILWDDTEDASCVALSFFLQIAANSNVLRAYGENVSFSWLDMEIGHFGRNITVLELPNIAFTLHEMLELVRWLPHLNKLRAAIDETDELHGTDRSHDNCRGICRVTWKKERKANGSTEKLNAENYNDLNSDSMSFTSDDMYDHYYQRYIDPPVRIREFLFTHLDAIYADMDFVDELYRQYYPLSKTLFHLDVGEYSNNLMAGSRMIALMCFLCPTILRVQTHRYEENTDFDSVSVEESYIERHRIEKTEQHASLVSRLQLSSISSH